MEVSIIDQFTVMLISAVLGLILGAIYDIIRIWRTFLGINYINKFTDKLKEIKLPLIENPMNRERKHSKLSQSITLFVTDIIYFFVVTFIMIIFIYHINNGVVRWYIFAGTMLGLFIYYFTAGKIVISVSEYITFFIKVFLKYIIFFITRPFVPIVKHIKIIFLKAKKLINRPKKKKISSKTEKNRQELMKIGKV